MLDKTLIEVGTVGKFNMLDELGKLSSRLPVLLGQENHGSPHAGGIT